MMSRNNTSTYYLKQYVNEKYSHSRDPNLRLALPLSSQKYFDSSNKSSSNVQILCRPCFQSDKDYTRARYMEEFNRKIRRHRQDTL
ncbi:hypothetical protein [Trichoplusia ni ascovirus 2c]|uniref:hypothetical protein n=1 Tax=Trichoplusia ni ascovirus 2c TaxID=328615 RepID=UPI0000E44204|nr:hypothetical protein TNAV2c_gp044 [Trichoplusia ni ascovirus 2c]ABF70561.1 hypothetical protein [Trichoplusia ni ascovirus 2c]